MAEMITEVQESGSLQKPSTSVGFVRASRAALWGTLTAVGASLGTAIVGVSPVLHLAGGIGAVIGGIGIVAAGITVLRRAAVRLPWRFAGALSVPFGTSLVVFGLFRLLWRPVTVAAAFDPPLLFRLAIACLVILGPILLILVGADIARFLVRGMWGGDEEE